MTARIVMDVGGGPVVGSLTLPSTNVGDPVTLSNQDNTGVSGWRWEILDAPAPSPTLNPLPAPTFANTAVIANDVKGHTVYLRLTTYTDVGRTIIDDVDEQVIGIRFDPPFDWVIPAARQSIQVDTIRGWAAEMNRILRDVHTIIEVGTGSDWKQSVRAFVAGSGLPAHTRIGNVITADGNGALPVQDGVTLVVDDAFVLDYTAPNTNSGVYVVTALGDGSNPFVFTRRVDFDEDTEVTPGLRIPIEEGTVAGGLVARLLTTGAIVVNTTALDFDLTGTMQSAYVGGGAVALDVDGGNDLLWDSIVADPTGLGLFGIRRELGGGELTIFKAPDQLADNANKGTTVAMLSGKGSDQTGVGVDGTAGGDTTVGGILSPGGAGGPASGAGAAGGNGGDGGNFQGVGSAGGAGGVGVGADAGGEGGDGGPINANPGGGGVGGAAAGAGSGGVGGLSGVATHGKSTGGAGGDGSATGNAGAGGNGAASEHGAGEGGAAGADNGGGGAVGGVGGEGLHSGGDGGDGTGAFDGGAGAASKLVGGNGGTALGGGTDGQGGDGIVEAGTGAVNGAVRIGAQSPTSIETGSGSTPLNHNDRRVIGLGVLGTVQTVADVITTIGSFQTVDDDRTISISGIVIARRADGEGKLFKFSTLCRRGTGAASTVVDSTDIQNGPQESAALTWTIVVTVTAGGLIQVQGDPGEATTIDWSVEADVQEI